MTAPDDLHACVPLPSQHRGLPTMGTTEPGPASGNRLRCGCNSSIVTLP